MLVYKLSKILTMTDRELYKYCEEVGAKARDWKKRFVALLPEVAKRNLFRKYGFASIVDFAGRLGGVGEYTVESVLRIQKYIEDKPALLEALPKVGVHKLRLIATIATKENQEILAKKAQEMSKSALEVWAKEIRPGTEIAKGIFAGKGLNENQNELFTGDENFKNSSNMSTVDERIHYSFDVDKDTDFKLRKHKLEIEKDIKRYATWCEVLKKLIDDIEIDSNEKIDKNANFNKTKLTHPQTSETNHNPNSSTLPVSQNDANNKPISRNIPVAIKRQIQEKYQGMCGYPGCNKPSTVLHHTKRYAISPNHENIVPLCSQHHELAHNGWIKNENDNPEKWLKGLYEGINKAKERIDQKVRLYSNSINMTKIRSQNNAESATSSSLNSNNKMVSPNSPNTS
jgi:hypothetical protein